MKQSSIQGIHDNKIPAEALKYHQPNNHSRIQPKGAPHLEDEAVQQELADLRELGVDDGDKGCKDGREGGRSHLRLHDAAAEQAFATVQILRAQDTTHSANPHAFPSDAHDMIVLTSAVGQQVACPQHSALQALVQFRSCLITSYNNQLLRL